MRFHKLVVRNFKGISAPAPLEFPASGVLVVEGPNEAGKTSLMEAVDLLFEFKDSSSHRRVLDAHPIGRDEAPYVELEMSTGPYRFVYAKRWARRGDAGARGRRGETTLHLVEPANKRYSGADAQAKATEILETTLDRSLWDALRLMQATSLPPVSLAGSSQLRAALDSAAGAGADAGGEGESILAAAEIEYRRYFTAATGKPTGEYEKTLRAVEQARASRDAAAGAVAEVQRYVQRHAAVCSEIEGLRARLSEAEAQRDALALREREAASLRGLLATAEESLLRAQRDERQAAAALNDRRDLIAEIAERTQACARAEEALTELRHRVERLDRAAASAREAVETAGDAADEARERLEAAREDVERHARYDEYLRLRGRLERIDELSEQIAEGRALLASLRVGEPERTSVQGAERVLDRALVAQRSVSTAVIARALGDDARLIVDGEGVDLGDDQRRWVLTEAMTLRVPGVVEVALVPEAGAQGRAAQVSEARRELTALLSGLGVATAQEAYAQADLRREAEQEVERREAARAAALAGDEIGSLRDRYAELHRTCGQTGGHDLPEREQPGLEALVRAESDARRRFSEARSSSEKARSDGEAARLESTGAEADATAGRRELTSRAAALDAARATASDAALLERFDLARAERASAARARDDLSAQVEELTGQGLFEAAERAATAAAERLHRAQNERVGIEAVLEEVGGQGRAERLDTASTELEAAERVAADMTRHAQAARLLFFSLRRHSDEAKAAYVAPFTAAVTRLGRLVYGPSFGVVVAPDLTIEERELHGVSVPYASLSTGAKEQLAILVRLACAQLVDSDDGVPVVIDDALGYSDPDRILATTAAFEHVGERAQVVMLTCTPGRYDGVRDANIVRLSN